MFKLVIVTDPDSAHGFRLSGVDVVEAKDLAEAKKRIIELINDDSSGIIAVNEEFMAVIDERTREKIEKIYRPVVISFPAKRRLAVGEMRREDLARLIRRAVGFDIRLRGE